MIRALLFLLGILIVLAIVVWVAGSVLPREHRAASRITLQPPVESVWAVVRNPAALKGTWKEMTAAEQLPNDPQGREVWQETVGGFDLRLIITQAELPSRLVTQVDAPAGSAFGGQWIYRLETTPAGTSVTVAEEGWIGPPPLRVMSKVMGYHRSIDQYLTALGRHFGETVTPEHVP